MTTAGTRTPSRQGLHALPSPARPVSRCLSPHELQALVTFQQTAENQSCHCTFLTLPHPASSPSRPVPPCRRRPAPVAASPGSWVTRSPLWAPFGKDSLHTKDASVSHPLPGTHSKHLRSTCSNTGLELGGHTDYNTALSEIHVKFHISQCNCLHENLSMFVWKVSSLFSLALLPKDPTMTIHALKVISLDYFFPPKQKAV